MKVRLQKRHHQQNERPCRRSLYREDGKVKLNASSPISDERISSSSCSPKLRRLLSGETPDPADLQFGEAPDWGPVLVIRALFDQLGLWHILDHHLAWPKAFRSGRLSAFVLVANRLIAPARARALPAGSKNPTFVCDRKGRRFIPHWHQRRRVRIHPRQLDAWYRTLDQRLVAARTRSKWALYHPPLRPLQPQARSGALRHPPGTYFRGSAGPQTISPSTSYSRDGKSQNVAAGDRRHGDGRGAGRSPIMSGRAIVSTIPPAQFKKSSLTCANALSSVGSSSSARIGVHGHRREY